MIEASDSMFSGHALTAEVDRARLRALVAEAYERGRQDASNARGVPYHAGAHFDTIPRDPDSAWPPARRDRAGRYEDWNG